jgi:hypothetical protein
LTNQGERRATFGPFRFFRVLAFAVRLVERRAKSVAALYSATRAGPSLRFPLSLLPQAAWRFVFHGIFLPSREQGRLPIL